jgi:hypothetical protein
MSTFLDEDSKTLALDLVILSGLSSSLAQKVLLVFALLIACVVPLRRRPTQYDFKSKSYNHTSEKQKHHKKPIVVLGNTPTGAGVTRTQTQSARVFTRLDLLAIPKYTPLNLGTMNSKREYTFIVTKMLGVDYGIN